METASMAQTQKKRKCTSTCDFLDPLRGDNYRRAFGPVADDSSSAWKILKNQPYRTD
jgi:hypothetical protein